MRTSLSIKSSYPGADDSRDAGLQFMERVAVAEEQQLDGLYLGDHHLTGATYLQNVPLLSRALAIWGSRPVGALFLLPLWPAVLLAEQLSSIAALAEGPFVLQCALGSGARQFAGMGVDLSDRRVLFERRLADVRALLSGHGVDVEVDGEVQRLGIAPTPPEAVDVWIGAHTAPAIDRAARLGDAWYAAPRHPVTELRELMDVYVSACTRHDVSPSSIPVRRDVHVAADRGEAERLRAEVQRAGHRGFDPASVLIGVHDEVVDAFAELAEIGFTEVVCRQFAPAQPEALASLERVGDVRRAAAGITPAPRFGAAS